MQWPAPRVKPQRWLAMFAGAYALALLVLVWGSLAKVPVNEDEAAYLLQARIFASGQITAAQRPIGAFFQQEHVFVEPVLAAKYPPGQALTLLPGVWLGLPGLMPGLLVALSAAILFSLTARLTNATTALLAVLLATTSDIALRFNASYFSEGTTTTLFLVSWWALFKYWESRRGRFLVLFGLAMAWAGITRPYTMAAFALPAGIATLAIVRRRGAWRDLIVALGCSAAVVGLLPLWNARVTGTWRMTQSEYARLYMPSDRLGFGESASPPEGRLSVEQRAEDAAVRRLHAPYVLSALPSAAAERASNILRASWSYGGLPCIAILFGVLVIPVAVARLLMFTVLCVFGAYLAYAHDPTWTLYYLELEPALAFLTAAGVYGASRWAGDLAVRRGALSAATGSRIAQVVFGMLALVLVLPAASRAASYRRAHAEQREYRERFLRAAANLPHQPSIIFVRGGSNDGEARLVDNVPDLAVAPVWTVHDCGADNQRLLALAPQRLAYLYRESPNGGGAILTLSRLSDSTASLDDATHQPVC